MSILNANRVKLTESTDARNARMMRLFRDAKDDFARHVALIDWQENGRKEPTPQFTAWAEGPRGLSDRIARGVPGYERAIREAVTPAQ
ncbi:hypothetical protein RCSAXON_26 [Rhodobacter phage RcSaxon]|uniref:Uncharacterized protein n=1 Tax=Rhodobacter phage RcSaxon TaxID=1698423 RepID=A0A0K1Y702_9CAUD|nr:hypothetical protein RCSAXON_26 [Rhodobacter phage RcSaxon]